MFENDFQQTPSPIQNQQPVPMQTTDTNFIYNAEKRMDQELMLKIVTGQDLLEELLHTLKGETFNIEKNAWEKVCEPLMNDIGVNDVIRELLIMGLDRNTIMSTLNENFISSITEEINMVINCLIYTNYEKYAVPVEFVPSITLGITLKIHNALRRAKEGTTLKFFTSTETHNYSYVTPNAGQTKEKGGLFNLFKKVI